MTKIRFAIVGTNFISDRFAEAVKTSGCAEIVAVFSRKLNTGRHFADKYGIKKVFCDYTAMLSDGDIDAVYIASPPSATVSRPRRRLWRTSTFFARR